MNNINLDVKRGDKICIVGRSGVGKSTLLRCVNLLEYPSSGDIFFDGKSILSKDTDICAIRSKIGMIFQSFNLFSHLTVLKNITLALIHIKKIKKNEAKDIAMELLKKVGLESKTLRYPANLSGGEKQRVAIVRTLALKPKILLIDEPTSSLDPKSSREITTLLSDIVDKNVSMISVSHDMNFVKSFANRIVFMEHGEINHDGPADEKCAEHIAKLEGIW
ncbi:MAG: amino acid ABC transporter ATP-binding protein [Candidatus Improbicoccus pseudotrichonymphae]|uniref:Amino acid ABC transporter ATP-binding protein n=1 Tax=Candidatus Improbicoccus pseudotrichonymphae TaxID=3033792 RepID=A0AA48L104_9FIRM|nr:MAG: amino acid ABC transporter ATP-binding protein [Candidatus Improbicoccus pseudotrichonymphae]